MGGVCVGGTDVGGAVVGGACVVGTADAEGEAVEPTPATVEPYDG